MKNEIKTVASLPKRLLGLLFISLVMVSVEASAVVAPDKFLEEKSGIILNELQRDSGDLRQQPEKLRALVEKHLLPLIDFTTMSKLVLGKNWKKASSQQRDEFVAAFENLLIRTYTKSIREYANVDIRFFPKKTKVRDDKYAKVYSELVPGGGKPNVPVEYSLKFDGNQWLVYDVTIEGLSLVKNYRDSFKDEIKATSLDSLIARLKKNPDSLIKEEG
ncbi:MAG: MlaC/ttg2D family ABC transporter substrate-binding protein [bacterium]